ncbi:MAG: CvpA family protein, partial [Limisphaerales bacterium]
MIVWIIALVLIAAAALLGYYQGAIRVAFSFAGLLFGALLAMPLSPVFRPLVGLGGVRYPWLKQIIAPVIVFALVVILFKIAAVIVHRKVEFIYKYGRTDDQRYRWERLNQKLGLCLGAFNGALYFFLLLIPVYVLGYLTVQLASSEKDPASMRFLNNTRQQVHSAKLDKVLAGYDPAPPNFYEAADILGLMNKNRLLWSRLARYPTFLTLAERPEFQAISTDVQLNEMNQRQTKVSELVKHPKVQAVLTNADLTAEIARLVGSDLKDLRQFVETGKSVKYDDEKILGRWELNLGGTIALEKKKHSNLSLADLKQLRSKMRGTMSGATLTATTDNKVFLKGTTATGKNPSSLLAQGSWKQEGVNYQVTLQA